MSEEQKLVLLEVLRDHVAAIELACVREVRAAYQSGFEQGKAAALAAVEKVAEGYSITKVAP